MDAEKLPDEFDAVVLGTGMPIILNVLGPVSCYCS